MISYNVELNSKPRKDGRYSVLLRITNNRKHKRISTAIFLNRRDINLKAKHGKWIKISHNNHKKLNKKITDKISQLEDIAIDLENEQTVVDTQLIIQRSRGSKVTGFYSFMEKDIERCRARSKYRTALKRRHILNKLKEFRKDDIPLVAITITFVNDYETFLYKKGNHPNTIYSDLKVIRTVLNNAISEGLMPAEKNPFIYKKLKEVATKKERLSYSEIQDIINLDLIEGTILWHVRNYFLFAFYCAGIRFGDFVQLTWSNIKGNKLEYGMDKTEGSENSYGQTPIPDQAIKILNNYKKNGHESEDFVFPIFSQNKNYSNIEYLKKQISSKNAVINKQLKILAEKAKIDKLLSFHMSRHSFADYARKNSTDLYGLSKLLRHSSLSMTQKYLAEFDNESTEKVMEDVFGK